jgi:hypothetical protein
MPLANITFNDVHLSAKKGLRIANAKEIQFTQSEIKAAQGKSVISANAEIAGLPDGK